MKKLLLTASLIIAVSFQAQETSETSAERQNDIMISPIELIAGPALNVSYERLLNRNSGIGINAVVLLDKETADSGITSQIAPYYRMYFGKKYASGFFVEAFVPITMSNDSYYNFIYDPQFGVVGSNYNTEKNTTVGIGVGFGGKWVVRNNIIFEASIGIARRFGMSDTYDESAITGKGMLGIGYRF